MSDPNRLSPEVLANLRAIRAGEPWPCPEIAVPLYAVNPPNDLVPNSTWRLTPDGVAVLAIADERDALRKAVNVQAHLAMLPESSVQAMKDLGRNVQPESIYMVPDWAVEPDPDALGERPPMRLTRAGKAWLAERVARMSNAADARVNALDNRVREVFTEPITAEEGIERLVRERDALRQQVAENDAYEAAWAAGAQAACARQPVQDCPYTDESLCKAWVSGYAYDAWIPGGVLAAEREGELQGKIEALRKRVADFECLLTEPKVEQARLLALRDLSEKLYTDGSGYTTVEARQDEILSAFLDVVDEALAANLHRRLNKGVAGALGLLEMQKDPKTGESYLPSWHDLPERVAALVKEQATRDRASSDHSKTEAEIRRQLAVGLEVEKMGYGLEALIECAIGRHVALRMERADAISMAKNFAALFGIGTIESDDGWCGPSWAELFRAARQHVNNLNAARERIERLTAERVALLAPVEGASEDLDVLVNVTCEDPKHDGLWCPTCEEYPTIRALAREVIRLRAALHLADEHGAEAIKRVSREIVADKWNSTAELQAEVERLTAKLCEAQLTLAAEVSKPEGATSARWTTDGHNWYGARPDGGMDKIERWSNLTGDGTIKHCRGWTDIDRFGFEKDMGRFNFAREGMLAADARLASTGGAR